MPRVSPSLWHWRFLHVRIAVASKRSTLQISLIYSSAWAVLNVIYILIHLVKATSASQLLCSIREVCARSGDGLGPGDPVGGVPCAIHLLGG